LDVLIVFFFFFVRDDVLSPEPNDVFTSDQ
jgi:hypothetical protein